MKKRRFLTMALLGGLIMIGLTGCGENKNSREWIENKVSEVSRVYPTENLFDLFKQFPEGFNITQTFYKDSLRTVVSLDGDAENQTIKGKIETIQISTDPYKEEVKDQVDVEYKDGQFIFFNNEVAEKIWGYKGFLFQKLSLNRDVLSQMKLEKFQYFSNRNVFEIYYISDDSTINNFLNSNGEHILSISGAESYNNTKGYRLNVNIAFKDNPNDGMSEIVSSWTFGNWLEIEYLFVKEELRGQGIGSKLLQQAENEAKNRNCRFAFVNTYQFQAPDFYKRHDYKEVFALQDYPYTGQRYYYQKDL